MITRNTLAATALASTCLVPLVAFADDFNLEPVPPPAAGAAPGVAIGGTPFTGDVELGVMGVVGNNPNQAGRYTGLNTNGFDVLGQFDLHSRPPWNSDGTRYYDFTGDNLVFQTGSHLGTGLGSDNGWASSTSNSLVNAGSLGFKAGDQGTWGIHAYYDAITYTGNVIDSLYTVNGGQATLNNNLPAWGGATKSTKGTTSFTINQLWGTGAMEPVQVGTRRDIIGGDFKYIYGDWTFTGAARHEHKEGSLEESFGGGYEGTAFALPINYDTDRYDASAAYNTRKFQGIFQYTYSHFVDNINFVNLPSPISGGAAPFQQSAAYSLPPSNDAHYFTLMLASNDLVPKTRLNLNARFGLELQDNTFAPNTADPNPPAGFFGPGLLNSNLQGTTASSPDMMADVYQIKASATSHPTTDIDTRVYYGVDGRNVSLNQFAVNTGSEGGFGTDSSVTKSTLQFVVPQDWLKQNAGGEVAYRILPESDTKVTVGYRFDDIERSNAQVGHSSTNTASIALMSQIGSQANGKLSFDYADRTGVLNYLTPWANLAGTYNTSPYYSGAYYQAPMTSEAVTARADYTPINSVTGDVFVQFKNENYTYPAATTLGSVTSIANVPLTGVGQGIKQDYALTVGPDVTYRPTKDTNFHFFYTYELLFFNNTGNGACSTPAEAATAGCKGTAGYFQNLYTSGTHTVGLSGEWKVDEKLKLRGEYTISYGSVMFGEYNGVFIANPTQPYQNVSNYPDIDSLMNSLKLTATYEVVPNMDLILEGIFTSYRDNNWNDTANAIQGAGSSAISILTPGYTSPNYAVGIIMTGVKFRF